MTHQDRGLSDKDNGDLLTVTKNEGSGDYVEGKIRSSVWAILSLLSDIPIHTMVQEST